MARGGYRPGAGRKKGTKEKNTLIKEEALRILREKVLAEIEPIAHALLGKAKAGDVTAAKELFDRAFGKAVQPVAGDEERPFRIIFDNALSSSSEGDSKE